MMSREYRMKEKLDQIKDKYDFIVIDCPPSLGINFFKLLQQPIVY